MHALYCDQTVGQEEIINKKFLIFYPPNVFKDIYWDLLQSLCLLVTCLLTPFNLAFSE